jgi:hypothetical protein
METLQRERLPPNVRHPHLDDVVQIFRGITWKDNNHLSVSVNIFISIMRYAAGIAEGKSDEIFQHLIRMGHTMEDEEWHELRSTAKNLRKQVKTIEKGISRIYSLTSKHASEEQTTFEIIFRVNQMRNAHILIIHGDEIPIKDELELGYFDSGFLVLSIPPKTEDLGDWYI